MRTTIYVPNHGYITKDDEFDYVGNGILGDIGTFVKNLVTSNAAKTIATEAGKSFASTAGKKVGEKAADKLVNKVFSSKKTESTPKSNTSKLEKEINELTNKMNKLTVSTTKSEKKPTKDILNQIYGDGLFRQHGENFTAGS